MRYQQYKNKMLRIRKVIDFFYRFRFVFAGAIAAIVATSIVLDTTRGNIIETSSFEKTYKYGEPITYSGSAFMGKVTYEFRRKGEEEWSEETPKYAGEYEARAKSQGSHGYKYSAETTFKIEPYETTFTIKNDRINFGDESPELAYTLLPGDRLEETYKVDYLDKTAETTTASINTQSLKIFNSDNVDVTDCYTITTESKDITFIPQVLTFTFTDPGAFTYTGNVNEPFTGDEYEVSGSIFYGAHPVISGGISTTEVINERNHHNISIIDDEGNDYTANYDFVINENWITVNKAPALSIFSPSLTQTYNGKPFSADKFTADSLIVNGLLSDVHEITDVVFDNTDVKECSEAKNIDNSFTYSIRDKSTGEVINPRLYYQDVLVDFGKINIEPISITVHSPNIDHIFDYKQVFGYEEGVSEPTYDGDLIAGDMLKVVTFPTEQIPGKYANDYKCEVHREVMVDGILQEINVSNNYDIHYDLGDININVVPLVIQFDGQDLTYDGAPHKVYKNDNQGHIVSGYLQPGWTMSATVYDSLNTYDPFNMETVLGEGQSYKADETKVEIYIWDEYGNPMTDYYRIDKTTSTSNNENCDVTFIFGESHINKAVLNITVEDFDDIVYNNLTLEDNLDLSSRVHSSGLQGDDIITVDYGTSSQKNIKDASETSYSVGLNIQVVNKYSGVPTGGNYKIEYDRAEPITASVKIHRKYVKIYTPDLEMVYRDSNIIPQREIDFSGVVVYDEYGDPIDDLTVSYNKNKNYTAPDVSVGTYTYNSFSKDDLIISYKGDVVHQNGVLDNYDIDLIYAGTIKITQRPLDIYQTIDETKDHIFYDGENHGVFTGSAEVDYSRQQGDNDEGLIDGHTLTFENPYYKNTANGPGEAAQYGKDVGDKVAYFGTTVSNSEGEVTPNYEIHFFDDYFNINIIKKKIDIYSGSSKKVFDGAAFDLYTEYNEDQWVDITDMKDSQFRYEVTRYDETKNDYVNANLDGKDRVQVKKTKADILSASSEVGSHTNEFEWRVVDENGVEIARDHYNVVEHYGVLEVKKLTIDLYTNNREKEYDSQNITYPDQATSIDSADALEFSITTNSFEQGVRLEYRPVYDIDGEDPTKIIPFNQTAFESRFQVRADIYKGDYPKFYLALSDPYWFNVVTNIYLKGTNTLYDNTSNVQLSFYSANLSYRVTKVRIELQQTRLTSTLELRILIGSLKADDVLYFGSEKHTAQLGRKPRQWESEFSRENVHIYRNGNFADEVTDCYYIVM